MKAALVPILLAVLAAAAAGQETPRPLAAGFLVVTASSR